MGLGQKYLTRVGSIFSGWVSSTIYGLGLDLENFPLKRQIFQFFPLRNKKYPGQRQFGLLFTVGQKYARVRAQLKEG